MRRHVYDPSGTLLRVEEADPVCGEDFCDRCGDCLACYQDGCFDDGVWTPGVACFWVRYDAKGRADDRAILDRAKGG
jgi:hypothetical protein